MERTERQSQLAKMYDGLPYFIRGRIELAVYELLWEKDSLDPFITRAAWCRAVVREELDGYPVEMRKNLLEAILWKMQDEGNLDGVAYRTVEAVLADLFSAENEEGKWRKLIKNLMVASVGWKMGK